MWFTSVTQFEIPIPWISNKANQKCIWWPSFVFFSNEWIWSGDLGTTAESYSEKIQRKKKSYICYLCRVWSGVLFGEQKDNEVHRLIGLDVGWSSKVTGVIPLIKQLEISLETSKKRYRQTCAYCRGTRRLDKSIILRCCYRRRRSQVWVRNSPSYRLRMKVAGSLVASFSLAFLNSHSVE